MVFMSGLMEDATPLVNHVYQTFCDNRISHKRIENRKSKVQTDTESDLNASGKAVGQHRTLSHLLYSESVVQLIGLPLQNRYLNYFDHNDDDKKGNTKKCVKHIYSQ